jgi:FlaA1/EpsC-like NDP-sugar epimerase
MRYAPYKRRNAPVWLIFFIDLGIVLGALILAYLLRFNFSIPYSEYRFFPQVFPFVLVVRAVLLLLFQVPKAIIRYTSSSDTERIFTAVSVGTLVFVASNLARYFLFDGIFMIPFSIIIIEYISTTFLMIALRFVVKTLYMEWGRGRSEKQVVVIYGADDTAILTKRSLDRDTRMYHKVLAFIDPTGKKVGKKVEGVSIAALGKLPEILANDDIDSLIITTNAISRETKNELIDLCLQHEVRVAHVPPVNNWINGELTYKQIRDVRIEDLLGRQEIKLDVANMSKSLQGKRVLVTGAAGSIGAEICRQLAQFPLDSLWLIDQAESPLYDLEQEFLAAYPQLQFHTEVADITNAWRMEGIFEKFRPQIVYHAAAYKHVPLMEESPYEAIITNVWGTKNLVELSLSNQVERFVFISTDKAVNPTNVMGASKRIAEMYVQASLGRGKTVFVTTRFGNVLGSNGSVIPLFRKQIEKGGPITLTHPDITRYFMTIPEACKLVLEAGNMGQGGEIYLFDMGKSIRIYDLAEKMVRLSGLRLGEDIEIKIVGLRPGEKLYEELLANAENAVKTHHPQILIAQMAPLEFKMVATHIEDLIQMAHEGSPAVKLVELMKKIVPEYISNNSTFSALDVRS